MASVMVNPALRGHAFEMVPDVFRGLFDNCVRNDVLHRVSLYPVGIGRPGIARVPASARGSSLPSYYSRAHHFDSGVLVEFQPLDSLLGIAQHGQRVVMKVDVEGTENEVLRFGQQFLNTIRPDILCEVLATSAEPAELENLLPAGYGRYLIDDTSLRRCDRLEPDARFRDWLFTPRPQDELASFGIPVAEG